MPPRLIGKCYYSVHKKDQKGLCKYQRKAVILQAKYQIAMKKKILLNEIILRQAQMKISEFFYEEQIMLCAALNRNPYNTDVVQISNKVALVNTIYSTNLHKYKSCLQVHHIAQIIANIHDFDRRVAQGCPYLVNEIANKSKQYGINLFSFATKYCFVHNYYIYQRDDYSIYDSRVRLALNSVFGIDMSTLLKFMGGINYPAFNQQINDVLNSYNILIPYKRRLFDCLLWNLAKEEIQNKNQK